MNQRPVSTTLLTAMALWSLWLWRRHRLQGVSPAPPGPMLGPPVPPGLLLPHPQGPNPQDWNPDILPLPDQNNNYPGGSVIG
jgi:hypothetical protein